MVYCTECGTKNEDSRKSCSKCGANLEGSPEKSFERRAEDWGEQFGRRAEKWGEDFGKRTEEQCFGLPHGGAIIGLIIGTIIILLGVFWIAGIVWEQFWPLVIVIFGVLIIAGAVYKLIRS